MPHHFLLTFFFQFLGDLSAWLTRCLLKDDGLVVSFGRKLPSEAARDYMLAGERLVGRAAVDTVADITEGNAHVWQQIAR